MAFGKNTTQIEGVIKGYYVINIFFLKLEIQWHGNKISKTAVIKALF